MARALLICCFATSQCPVIISLMDVLLVLCRSPATGLMAVKRWLSRADDACRSEMSSQIAQLTNALSKAVLSSGALLCFSTRSTKSSICPEPLFMPVRRRSLWLLRRCRTAPLHARPQKELVTFTEVSYRCRGCFCDIVDIDSRRSAVEAGAAEEPSASWVTSLGKRLAMVPNVRWPHALALRSGHERAKSRV
jgi:hypothetical protein